MCLCVQFVDSHVAGLLFSPSFSWMKLHLSKFVLHSDSFIIIRCAVTSCFKNKYDSRTKRMWYCFMGALKRINGVLYVHMYCASRSVCLVAPSMALL